MTSIALKRKVESEIEASRKEVFKVADRKDERVAIDSIRQQCWRITTLEEVLQWLDE